MVKHAQTIHRLLPKNCLSVFHDFVGLALKGLNIFSLKLGWKSGLIFLPFSKLLHPSVQGNPFDKETLLTQLTGFYMRTTQAFNGLITSRKITPQTKIYLLAITSYKTILYCYSKISKFNSMNCLSFMGGVSKITFSGKLTFLTP